MSIADRKKKLDAAKGFIKTGMKAEVVHESAPVPVKRETPAKSKDARKKQANYLLDGQLKIDIQIEATRQGIYPAQLVGKVMREYLEEKGKKREEP